MSYGLSLWRIESHELGMAPDGCRDDRKAGEGFMQMLGSGKAGRSLRRCADDGWGKSWTGTRARRWWMAMRCLVSGGCWLHRSVLLPLLPKAELEMAHQHWDMIASSRLAVAICPM